MTALAQILPTDPNIKPLWLPSDLSAPKRRRTIFSWLARLTGRRTGKIIFAQHLRDDSNTADLAIRSAEVGERVYLQASFPSPVSSEDHLTLRVSAKGGPGQADQTVLEHAVPTLSEMWKMGHLTSAGERIFPAGPAPEPRDTHTLVVFSRPTAPLAIGDYQFALADAAGQILSSGRLSVLAPTPKK